MFKRMAVLAACLVGLSGCILQSEVPLFSDKDSVLALGVQGGAAKMESLDNGEWVAEKEPLSIRVKGRHYEAVSKTSTVVLHFVSLGGDAYVLQGAEDGKESAYLIAEVKDGVALVRPLACKDVKQEMKVSRWIKFDGDNCLVPLGSPAPFIFKTLAGTKGEFTSRLTIIPQ